MSDSPSPGSGKGVSSIFRTDGGPNAEKRSAFITRLLTPILTRAGDESRLRSFVTVRHHLAALIYSWRLFPLDKSKVKPVMRRSNYMYTNDPRFCINSFEFADVQ